MQQLSKWVMTSDVRQYALDSETEPLRLEFQAKLAGLERHLEHVPLTDDAFVLDAGCGSGSMTRLLARNAGRGRVVGVDLNQEYLHYARTAAAEEGLQNVEFREGDLFALPFPDGTFDLVWSKYVLQWVNDPVAAVAEFKRVAKPGGTVLCSASDNLLVCNYPEDQALQRDIERVFQNLFDPNVGRKLYEMFHRCGLDVIQVHIEEDRLFSIIGPIDGDRRWNIGQAYDAFMPHMTQVFGSEAAAEAHKTRHLEYLDRADTISPCFLFFVKGIVG